MPNSEAMPLHDRIILSLIGCLILINFTYIFRILPADHNSAVPGGWAAPLKPFLKNVNVATYYTDRYSLDHPNDPESNYFFQQTQYTLSPVMLFMDNDLTREIIVFDCKEPGCYKDLLSRSGHKPQIIFNDHIGVLRKPGY